MMMSDSYASAKVFRMVPVMVSAVSRMAAMTRLKWVFRSITSF